MTDIGLTTALNIRLCVGRTIASFQISRRFPSLGCHYTCQKTVAILSLSSFDLSVNVNAGEWIRDFLWLSGLFQLVLSLYL